MVPVGFTVGLEKTNAFGPPLVHLHGMGWNFILKMSTYRKTGAELTCARKFTVHAIEMASFYCKEGCKVYWEKLELDFPVFKGIVRCICTWEQKS